MDKPQETVNQRLNFLVETFEKGKKAAFARKIGISAQGVQEMLVGRRSDPSFKVLVKILESYPTVDANWLVLGQGSMYREVADAVLVPDTPPNTLTPEQMQAAFQHMLADKLGLDDAFERVLAESEARTNSINTLELEAINLRMVIDEVSAQITAIRNGDGDEGSLSELKEKYLKSRDELHGKYQLISTFRQQDKNDARAARALSEQFAHTIIRSQNP